MALQIVFILISLFTLVSAWIVVTNRNLFHAALAMMATFLGVAAFYVMLDAGVLAVAQLLVYIGAISILVIFAIMMTRRLMQTTESPFNSQWQGALVAAISGLVIVLIVVWYWGYWGAVPGAPPGPAQAPAHFAPEVPAPLMAETVTQLGVALVSPDQYVIPFEVASILLLAALIGAIFIARPRREEE